MCRFALLLSFLVCFIGATRSPAQGTSAAVSRDWVTYPAIVKLPASRPIYVLGDVHGDYDRLIQLLSITKVIDSSPSSATAAHWSAGSSILVCTGDFIDKYHQSVQVVQLLKSLQQDASSHGGQVIITLGNHEAEFLASHGNPAIDFSIDLQKAGLSATDVANGTDDARIGAWLRNLPAAGIVGDWLFCHAGNTGGLDLPTLSKTIRDQVTVDGWAAPILADPNSMLEARMKPRPWWEWNGQPAGMYDVAATQPSQTASASTPRAPDQNLRTDLAALNCRHLVFGHQPGKITFADGSIRAAGTMFSKYDGMVFLIDTGMSRGVQAGRAALLYIDPSKSTASALYIDGQTARLWP